MWMAMVIPLLIFGLGMTVPSRETSMSERGTSYECGYMHMSGGETGSRFSLYFFQLALLFLVFDVELVVLMPLVESSSLLFFNTICVFVFLGGLVLGYLHEWREGSLERPAWYVLCISSVSSGKWSN